MTRDSEHFGSRRAVDWAESETYAQAMASNSPDGDKVLAQSAECDRSSARILNDVASKEWLMSATEERICTLTERENGLLLKWKWKRWAIKRSCRNGQYAGAIDSTRAVAAGVNCVENQNSRRLCLCFWCLGIVCVYLFRYKQKRCY